MKTVKFLMLDSGAYSAWRKQEEIDLSQYIRYCHENQDIIDVAVNLDKIPGRFGKPPSIEEVNHSAQVGWDNMKRMEAEGIKPLPIFHQGEDYYWLHRMIDEGYDYIGISPDNGKATSSKKVWLDKVFSQITDLSGYPIVRTHGFGMTSVDLMFRYPWWSCDSMTWVLASSYGGILIPRRIKGEIHWAKSPWTIKISDKSPTLKQGGHFDHLSKMERENLEEEVFHPLGVTYEKLKTSFVERTILNVRVMQKAMAVQKDRRYRDKELFSTRKLSHKNGIVIPTMKLLYAINMSGVYSEILNMEGIYDRLFTYHLLKDSKPELLSNYVRTGRIPGARRKLRIRKRLHDGQGRVAKSAQFCETGVSVA